MVKLNVRLRTHSIGKRHVLIEQSEELQIRDRVKEFPHDMDERGKAKFDPNEPALESENDVKKQIPPPSYNRDEEWVQENIRQFGEEPSFF